MRTREAELDRDGRGRRRSPTGGTGPGAPAWAERGEDAAVAPEVARQRRQGRVSRGPLRGRTPGPRLRLRVHAAPAPLLAGPGLTPCCVRPQRATSAKTPFPGEATF